MTETTEPTNRRTLYGFIRDRLTEEESAGGDPKWIEVHRTMNRYGGLAVASAEDAPDDADYANGAATAWEIALQMLATRWSDHLDYREDWDGLPKYAVKVECDAETYVSDDDFRTHMGDTIHREDMLDLIAEGKATVIEWSVTGGVL